MPDVGPWNMETVWANMWRIFPQLFGPVGEKAAKAVRTKPEAKGKECAKVILRYCFWSLLQPGLYSPSQTGRWDHSNLLYPNYFAHIADPRGLIE